MQLCAFFIWFLTFLYYAESRLGQRNFLWGHRRGGNVGAPGIALGKTLPAAQWFEQRLDHFNPTNLKTWNQRYFVNDSYYEYGMDGVPIYLMLGGEGPADPKWMVEGTWLSYCKKYNGLCLYLEHRYYGDSRPTTDMSTKNLQYLTSQQALADIAAFIQGIQKKYNIRAFSRWIVLGGSYSGALAAWARVKYPHLIYAAVASSAPIFAELNFRDYYKNVLDALESQSGNTDCELALKEAHRELQVFVKTFPEHIDRHFRLCQRFDNTSVNDVNSLYETIASNIAELVQYNGDNRLTMKDEFKNVTIKNVCAMMTAPGKSNAYERLANFNAIILRENNQPCLDISYDTLIKELRNVTWTHDSMRQWMFQTCTEFGFFQTSDKVGDFFGNNFKLEYFTQQCKDVFGTKFTNNYLKKAVAWTNTVYGAFSINSDRIAFVEGNVDPWKSLAISNFIRNIVYIEGTAHCADMYPPRSSDPVSLKTARMEILQQLDHWLSMP